MSQELLLKIVKMVDGKEVDVVDINGDKSQAPQVYSYFIENGYMDLRIMATHLRLKEHQIPILLMPESFVKKDESDKTSIIDFEKEALKYNLKLIEPINLNGYLKNLSPKEFGKNKTIKKKWYHQYD